jgi:RNA polymerase sigma-70 factor (ECF subfamily)
MQAQFEALYERYYLYVLRFIRRRVNGSENAEDMAQETFTRAYAAFAGVCHRNDAGLRAWLFTIASHLVIDYLRRYSRVEVVDISACEYVLYAPDTLEPVVDRDEAERLLSFLNPQQQEMFRLYSLDFKHKEIEEMLSIQPFYVKVLMLRGRQKIKGVLRKAS